MSFDARRILICALALALVVVAVPADAQTHAIDQRKVAHYESSGLHDNPAGRAEVVFSTMVHAGDAPWLQLTFRRAVLDEGSMLRITSLRDGATQHLNARHLREWQNVSAYFNGGAVMVDLIAGPGTRGQIVEIGDIWAGMAPILPATQCGPTDDREPSNFPERGRLMSIGCTAWMFNENSCFATAGHCIGGSVVQFNVPFSNPNGSLNHPGPEDQYAVDTASRVWNNGGQGNDWGLFQVFPNSETGMMPYQVQGAFLPLASGAPALNETISVVGYGVDRNERERNQIQQYGDGPLVSASTNLLRYQADTEGGNSGSGVVYEATGEAIGIHTHGGCSTTGSGSNAGTAITHPALQQALASFCQELEITVTGTCPGPVTINISGAPANTEVGVVSAANNNGWVKGANQCAGTALEVGEPFVLPPALVFVDGSGNGSVNMNLQAGRCWVEALSFCNGSTSGATEVN